MSTENTSEDQANPSIESELNQEDLPKEDLDDIELEEEQEDLPKEDLNDI